MSIHSRNTEFIRFVNKFLQWKTGMENLRFDGIFLNFGAKFNDLSYSQIRMSLNKNSHQNINLGRYYKLTCITFMFILDKQNGNLLVLVGGKYLSRICVFHDFFKFNNRIK